MNFFELVAPISGFNVLNFASFVGHIFESVYRNGGGLQEKTVRLCSL
jgi:hypothetical protein